MQRLPAPHRRLAIGLAGLAGFVDGVGFLTAGGYFVSFMSGNTTRLAVDLATEPAKALLPALLIFGFACGVFGGAVVALKSGAWQARNVLALVSALLIAGAMAQIADRIPLALAALVLAMGALNNCFQREGESSFGLTYMTGALVRFGQGLAYRLCGRKAAGFADLLLLWGALGGGAVLGALTYARLQGLSIAIAAALGLFALAGAAVAGRDRRDHD
ncbi:MAG: DUF1275 family protein [Candidatus Andeanibacterium colombiense]|uniref:DUF1275 family protein n=1 Tax=Candidatus Andeanibacterium colombiense TaxID=3121345 RepID=A0AAJ6BLY6_9SPHN|nr:MAG: DUF1275 family protein [Sphingomonadaceae bacterium]